MGALRDCTAARIWDLPVPAPLLPQILIPRSRRGIKLDVAEIHTTTHTAQQDATIESDTRVTTATRTLIELAGDKVADEIVAEATVTALRRGLTSVARLRSRSTQLKRAHSQGPTKLLHILDMLDPDIGRHESILEDDLAQPLRSSGLAMPVFQFPIRTSGGWARLDAAYPDFKIGIEVDGYVWHSTPAQLARDRVRKNRLSLLDWTILNYTHLDLQSRPDEVTTEIESLYRSRRGALTVPST